MAPKAKMTISLELLKELGKIHLKEPQSVLYHSDDVNVVVESHQPFFMACCPHTVRLNSVSLAMMAKDLFQMNKREADFFGTALSSAFSHCMIAGAKATTGEKLSKAVLAVYNAAKKDSKGQSPAIKTEQGIKTEPMHCKVERSCSPPPQKFLKSMHIDSPNQIASLYGGSSSSSGIKNEVKVKVELDDDPLQSLYNFGMAATGKKEIKEEQKHDVKVEMPLGKPICTVDVTTMTCKKLNDGVVVPLTAGPANLLIADFGSYVHTTELSNLMLHAIPKAIKKCKKPAAAPAASDDRVEPDPIAPAASDGPVEPVPMPAVYGPAAPPPMAQERDDYAIEYYKKNKQIGIRQKFGGRSQVLSFGGKACTKSEAEMRLIAKDIVSDLNGGMSSNDAKAKANRKAFGE